MKNAKNLKRCAWVTDDPGYKEYHDKEWGNPVHDDRILFEFLVLEGAQAGLSWITILKKRENFRKAFDHFDVNKVAAYKEKKVQSLLKDEGIIRNELKIRSAVKNAQEILNIQKEYGSFDRYIWGFVNHKTIYNSWKTTKEAPNTSPEYDRKIQTIFGTDCALNDFSVVKTDTGFQRGKIGKGPFLIERK
ncbi:DNA-3-methyladenine glycosylase I [Leptospira alstonii]|uniref:DNA-3-methyladenine glycosylase I n=1 Tax=Leptospira alstonii TaxID=28452 RepID=UPI0009DAE8BE|nr:DNA-3-methyladenine glycosylase I [Leptospira alstonii]